MFTRNKHFLLSNSHQFLYSWLSRRWISNSSAYRLIYVIFYVRIFVDIQLAYFQQSVTFRSDPWLIDPSKVAYRSCGSQPYAMIVTTP